MENTEIILERADVAEKLNDCFASSLYPHEITENKLFLNVVSETETNEENVDCRM